MEYIIIVTACLVSYFIGYFARGTKQKKDDGVVIINEERVEVIFRDTYEKLIKKKFVNLRIQS